MPDDRRDAAYRILTDAERRLVELLAEALALDLRGEVQLLEEDAALPADRDDEEPA